MEMTREKLAQSLLEMFASPVVGEYIYRIGEQSLNDAYAKFIGNLVKARDSK